MHRTLPMKSRQRDISTLKLMQEIKQNIPKIERELVGDLIWYSPNARFIENSISLISVEPLEKFRYKMNYSFRWSVFNPCLDIDAEEICITSVNLTVDKEELVFDFIDNTPHTMSEEL